MTIAAATKIARRIAGGNFGYDQSKRWSGIKNGQLSEPGAFDCSSSSGVIAWLGGFIDRSVLSGTFYTGNFAKKLTGTGMYHAINIKGWSLDKLKKSAREGDFIIGPGHVVYSLGRGKIVSFEADERGKASGGKVGDQTGREGRVRDLYARSKGWAYIVRPYGAAEFQSRLLSDYAKTGKPSVSILGMLKMRSPWDGPVWETFMAAWATLDKGVPLAYSADQLTVPDAGHAFVVLGGSLNPDGSIRAQFRRRLALALTAAQRFPNSKVLVSGGAPQAGHSEAEAGRDWLVSQGLPAGRILIEKTSGSTIGNAKNSLPILRKSGLSAYTLVSDASHLRRASVLFLAAQLAIETTENRHLGISPRQPLAVNDYAPNPVKTETGVDAPTRTEITKETASLLGLTI